MELKDAVFSEIHLYLLTHVEDKDADGNGKHLSSGYWRMGKAWRVGGWLVVIQRERMVNVFGSTIERKRINVLQHSMVATVSNIQLLTSKQFTKDFVPNTKK